MAENAPLEVNLARHKPESLKASFFEEDVDDPEDDDGWTIRLQLPLHDPILRKDLLYLTIFTIVALATRFYDIRYPDSVCWDETHFGKFANHYLKNTFYFDVHPPLAKMLIALAGYLTNYRGDFEFKEPGQAYGATPYLGMRYLSALLGAMLIPMAYATVRCITTSQSAALLTALIVTCETSLLTASRFILLDPILLLFIQGAILAMFWFRSQQNSPFTFSWWASLALSGAMLGCAFSSKWVGLFIILHLGCYTIADLWELWGDVSLSLRQLAGHFLARALCLILLPVALYVLFFFIHFKVCYKTGPGDAFMSSAFQTSLVGSELHNTTAPLYLGYGSVVTIKHAQYAGALLHSHPHLFPKEYGQQQQVTGYLHKDDNNKWIIKAAHLLSDQHDDYSLYNGSQLLRSGNRIRLEHMLTRRNLHSHPIVAALNKHHYQVTAYGADGVGDVNDEFTIVKDGGQDGDLISPVVDKFRLVHGRPGIDRLCALHSDGRNLPEWGFQQVEITCNPQLNDPNTLWNVEHHSNHRLSTNLTKLPSASFWEALVEVHVAMSMVNNGLKPKEGEVTSQPWQWPITYRGQRFTRWGDTDRRVYLLGNAVIYWGSLVCLGMMAVVWLVLAAGTKRQLELPAWLNNATLTAALPACGWLLLAWAWHYLPFFLMGRVLYFHHYLPAIMILCTLSGIILDVIATMAQLAFPALPGLKEGLLGLCVAYVVWSFVQFSPLSYGIQVPLKDMEYLMWLPSWELTY
eukprot:TRINITY_DN6033_c0_g1_i1.p1 TRINITY_DN6033_c0_g1~~TRINITY_DN6033_c0_g1_i1.p1  ORF type:complete len:773 (+),score=123.18 TRINITY_DN6033_c0_g1_i1:81-2321(+)